MREGKVERVPPCSTHLLSSTLKALSDLAQTTCPTANSIDSFIRQVLTEVGYAPAVSGAGVPATAVQKTNMSCLPGVPKLMIQ